MWVMRWKWPVSARMHREKEREREREGARNKGKKAWCCAALIGYWNPKESDQTLGQIQEANGWQLVCALNSLLHYWDGSMGGHMLVGHSSSLPNATRVLESFARFSSLSSRQTYQAFSVSALSLVGHFTAFTYTLELLSFILSFPCETS